MYGKREEDDSKRGNELRDRIGVDFETGGTVGVDSEGRSAAAYPGRTEGAWIDERLIGGRLCQE